MNILIIIIETQQTQHTLNYIDTLGNIVKFDNSFHGPLHFMNKIFYILANNPNKL